MHPAADPNASSTGSAGCADVSDIAPSAALLMLPTAAASCAAEQARQQMLSQIPLKRFAEPEEIASVILFLCSPLSSYVTGQTLHVNGGWWA